MNSIVKTAHQQRPNNPFGDAETTTPQTVNAGAVAIEQERAIAEARGQIQLAKMFPRSMSAATAELVDACKSKEFAESAFYSVPNRGSGPSIRFAEEVARCYGNFEYGHRELSRSPGKSEIEVFAWDKERNNVSKRQITVAHVLDYTEKGTRKKMSRPLIDQADIDNRIANVASKQMRGRILALLPKALIELGVSECRKTLLGHNGESLMTRISSTIAAFSNFGVSPEQLSHYIGHSIDNCTVDDVTNLIGVHNALSQGARISDYFPAYEAEKPAGQSTSLSARVDAEKQHTTQPKKQPMQNPQQQQQQQQQQNMPDFGDPAPQGLVPVDELLKHLPACTTGADLGEWKQDAMKWPEGSPELQELITAYNQHLANLKAQSAQGEQ